MESFSITDMGRTRDSNQDSVFCEQDAVGVFPNLFLVADGMGGHNAGDLASKIGIEAFVENIRNCERRTPVGGMEDALRAANEAILNKSYEDPAFRGMGTTLVGMVVLEDTACVINIGDSRLYRIRDGIEQITVDHSLVEEMVLSGELQKDQMRTHPNKNIITRALGTTPYPKPDFFDVDIREKDVFLLCSDGLSNMLDDNEIEKIIDNEDRSLSEIGQDLIDAANEAGGKDNISAVLVRI